MSPELDIVIPVYNEGRNIVSTLDALRRSVRTPLRVLLCYDRDDDDTLAAVAGYKADFELCAVKSHGAGPCDAVRTGFEASSAPAVLVMPADDDYNAPIVDRMVEMLRSGCEIVAPSRFMPGGAMVGCPIMKAILVRSSALALYHVARVPTRDPSNGFRLFSRRVLTRIPIQSTAGFAYSIELLAKCHRLRWRICELPARWYERRHGRSRFAVFRWVGAYLIWFGYAFATTFLRRGPETVRLRDWTESVA